MNGQPYVYLKLRHKYERSAKDMLETFDDSLTMQRPDGRIAQTCSVR